MKQIAKISTLFTCLILLFACGSGPSEAEKAAAEQAAADSLKAAEAVAPEVEQTAEPLKGYELGYCPKSTPADYNLKHYNVCCKLFDGAVAGNTSYLVVYLRDMGGNETNKTINLNKYTDGAAKVWLSGTELNFTPITGGNGPAANSVYLPIDNNNSGPDIKIAEKTTLFNTPGTATLVGGNDTRDNVKQTNIIAGDLDLGEVYFIYFKSTGKNSGTLAFSKGANGKVLGPVSKCPKADLGVECWACDFKGKNDPKCP